MLKKNLNDMTLSELHQVAKDAGVSVPRRMPLALTKEVQPGERVIIEELAQIMMHPELLTIDPVCASSFRIHEVLIGNNVQTANIFPDGGAPATLFPPVKDPENEARLGWDFDTVQVGQQFKIAVENVSKEKKLFSAIVWVRASMY